MRADAAGKNGVAVVEQMMRRDGGGGVGVAAGDEVGGFFGGDVFKDDFQLRKVAPQGLQHAVDKHRFTVENINLTIRHLAMHQQQNAVLLHGFKRGVNAAHIRYASITIGGGTSGIELGCGQASSLGGGDFCGRQGVGQIQSHQRFKVGLGGQGRQDAFFVGQRLRHRGHGWLQIGHDDGAGKLRRRVADNGLQRRAVAYMQMPVVGAGDGQGVVLHGMPLSKKELLRQFWRPEMLKMLIKIRLWSRWCPGRCLSGRCLAPAMLDEWRQRPRNLWRFWLPGAGRFGLQSRRHPSPNRPLRRLAKRPVPRPAASPTHRPIGAAIRPALGCGCG